MQVLVDISKTQDEEIGDGTTSVAVLCGEMLREAEKLIEARIHPQTIVNGWRLACQEARRALEASAMDSGKDEAQKSGRIRRRRSERKQKIGQILE